jgi:hypothetical protein
MTIGRAYAPVVLRLAKKLNKVDKLLFTTLKYHFSKLIPKYDMEDGLFPELKKERTQEGLDVLKMTKVRQIIIENPQLITVKDSDSVRLNLFNTRYLRTVLIFHELFFDYKLKIQFRNRFQRH